MLPKSIRKIIKPFIPKGLYHQVKWFVASRKLIKGDSSWAKNAKYDNETRTIMSKYLKSNSNAIDIGASIGGFTADLIGFAPKGLIYSFEPIPSSFKVLEKRFSGKDKVSLHNIALSNEKASTNFYVMGEDTGYSGLKKTTVSKEKYGDRHSSIEVQTDKLDNIIPTNLKIDFIKIDVEGAELLVFEGAKNTIMKNKPVIVFECGKHMVAYGIEPEQIFDTLESYGMSVFNCEYFLAGKQAYSRDEFCGAFNKDYEFYYVSAPTKSNVS